MKCTQTISIIRHINILIDNVCVFIAFITKYIFKCVSIKVFLNINLRIIWCDILNRFNKHFMTSPAIAAHWVQCLVDSKVYMRTAEWPNVCITYIGSSQVRQQNHLQYHSSEKPQQFLWTVYSEFTCTECGYHVHTRTILEIALQIYLLIMIMKMY